MFNEYYDTKLKNKGSEELRFIKRDMSAFSNLLKQKDLKNIHIHIIGICGTAMGTFALMLRDCGFHVSGSDISFWPPMGPLLLSSGVDVKEGWSANNIVDSVDLVIVGNACAPDHIEVQEALKKKKSLMSMPEIMGEYFVGDDKESLVVAGTHGKTTTSGLLAYMSTALSLDPTYLIGGVMQTKHDMLGKKDDSAVAGTSHHIGKGHYVVLEGDEYDTAFFDARPKFLHYRPAHTIITSAEWDHVDIYADIDEYAKAFAHIIEVTQKSLIVSNTYPLLNKLMKDVTLDKKVIIYGTETIDGVVPNLLIKLGEVKPEGQCFEFLMEGVSCGSFITPMYGTYNTMNSAAVLGILMCMGVDIDTQKVRDALASFPGMKRRQEIVGGNTERNIVILDDFAHHPTAVAETLRGVRNRYPGRRIIALFEPRSNTSRRKIFEHTYPQALAEADLIGIKLPPYRAEVDAGKDLLDPMVIKNETEAFGKIVYLSETAKDLASTIGREVKDGDVIVLMSNGSFDGIIQLMQDQIC